MDEFEEAFKEATADKPVELPEPAPPAPAPAEPKEPQAPVEPKEPEATAKVEPEPAPPTVEELQRQVQDALHRERSSAHRISAFAKENNQLAAQVADMRKKLEELAAREAAPPPPAPPSADDDEPDYLADAPDMRKSVEKLIEKATSDMRKQLEAANKKLEEVGAKAATVEEHFEPIRRQNEQQQYEQTFSELDKQFTPAWREEVRTERFAGWLDSQAPQIKHLYQNGVTPAESGTVLKLYFADTKTTTPPPAPAGNSNERLRLAAGIAPRGSSARTAEPAADDYEGAFAYAQAQLQRQAAMR